MSAYPMLSTRSVYLAVLKKTDPSPLAPESDEEKIGGDKPDKPADKPAEGEKQAEASRARSRRRSGEAGREEGAAEGRDRHRRHRPADPGAADPRAQHRRARGRARPTSSSSRRRRSSRGRCRQAARRALTVQKYDLEKRKLEKVLEGVSGFEVSANGEKMLYRQQQNWFIASTTQPVKPGEGKLKTDDMEVRVDPVAEWNQMYREVWRLERDFFYDPEPPRPRPAGDGEEVRAVPEERGAPRGPQLPVRRDARRADGRAPVHRRGRRARGEAGPRRAARLRLLDRERALPVRPRLQRRELEPEPARAAHAARRQRPGRRVPAGRQRAGSHRVPRTSTAASRTRPTSRWSSGSARTRTARTRAT